MLLSNSKLFLSWQSTKESYLNNFKEFTFVQVIALKMGEDIKLKKFVS